MRSPGQPAFDLVTINAVRVQLLTNIQEDDYIGLDDLISPLLGVNSCSAELVDNSEFVPSIC